MIILTKTYQLIIVLYHIFRDINSKNMAPGGCGCPLVCLSMQRSHNVHTESSIFVPSNETHDNTFMNVMGSPKFLQFIAKKESVTIFMKLYKVFVSSIVEQHISWIIWGPLSMIRKRNLNDVLHINISRILFI